MWETDLRLPIATRCTAPSEENSRKHQYPGQEAPQLAAEAAEPVIQVYRETQAHVEEEAKQDDQ